MPAVNNQKAVIFKLPSEVAEFVVVLLADSPAAVSAFAQTCRYYRSLIYDTPDDHLWRNSFLLLFNDYHPVDLSKFPIRPLKEFVWEDEYKLRVWSCRYLERERMWGGDSIADPDSTRKALHVVLNMLETTAPQLLTDVEGKSSFTMVQAKDESLVRAHFRSPMYPSHPHGLEELSATMRMYYNTVSPGLPMVLVRKLFTSDEHASQALLKLELYRYITFNGLCVSSQSAIHLTGDSERAETVEVGSSPSSNAVSKAFRRPIMLQARRRVYNMAYPQRNRLFGPFVASHRRPTKSSQCLPDWEQLAAARLVVDEAIRGEHEGEDITIFNLIALRAGRWINVPNVEEIGTSSDKDWAGVAGLWRRFVTWYGYSTLLDINDSDFDDEVMESAWEVRACVPVRLRIASYTHDDGSPEAFPTINVEGEMGGEGWRDRDEDDPNDDGDQRYVDGKVSMLGDGTVRWSMWTYLDVSKRERQWASEGIQLGCIGSTAGAIGMWTGANHEDGDPVGAWWQWRVE